MVMTWSRSSTSSLNLCEKKKTASPSVQLKYASKQLEKKGTSGTSQVYAEGLKQASQKFSGKELNSNTAIDFIQTLMGGAAQSTGSATATPVTFAGNDCWAAGW